MPVLVKTPKGCFEVLDGRGAVPISAEAYRAKQGRTLGANAAFGREGGGTERPEGYEFIFPGRAVAPATPAKPQPAPDANFELSAKTMRRTLASMGMAHVEAPAVQPTDHSNSRGSMVAQLRRLGLQPEGGE